MHTDQLTAWGKRLESRTRVLLSYMEAINDKNKGQDQRRKEKSNFLHGIKVGLSGEGELQLFDVDIGQHLKVRQQQQHDTFMGLLSSRRISLHNFTPKLSIVPSVERRGSRIKTFIHIPLLLTRNANGIGNSPSTRSSHPTLSTHQTRSARILTLMPRPPPTHGEQISLSPSHPSIPLPSYKDVLQPSTQNGGHCPPTPPAT